MQYLFKEIDVGRNKLMKYAFITVASLALTVAPVSAQQIIPTLPPGQVTEVANAVQTLGPLTVILILLVILALLVVVVVLIAAARVASPILSTIRFLNESLADAQKRADDTQDRADKERENYDRESRTHWVELGSGLKETTEIQRAIVDQLAHPETRFEKVVTDLKGHADDKADDINAHTEIARAANEKALGAHFEQMDKRLDSVVASLEDLRNTAITGEVFTRQMNPMVLTLDSVLKTLHEMREESSPHLEVLIPPPALAPTPAVDAPANGSTP